jgi:histidinol-phosphate aminotransferase
MRDLRPAPGLARITAYKVPRPVTPVDLHLDGNEGLAPPSAVLEGLVAQDPELLRRYPDARGLERLIAERLGVQTDHVLVTAGADDAIDRLCRAVLTTGRRMIVPEPTFSMIERFVLLAGGDFVSIPWTDVPYPIDAVLDAVDERTAAIAVVSPNNPTGGVATAEDVRRLSAAAPQALVLVDHAYMEFGGEDLTPLATSLSNVVVLRTLSKAWGLAGLRVGFAVARPELIGWLQTAGHPFAVSGPSLVLAHQWLEQGGSAVEAFVAEVRRERPLLEALLARLGGRVAVSQGNFAFARFDNALDDALWVRDGLAGLSMGVRAFPGDPLIADAVRITCPGDRGDFERLTAGLETVLAPEAILFDMDGVLADVSRSYRQAIVETVRHFGEKITAADIAVETGLGDANNDWVLSRRLLSKRGVIVELEEVTRIFEALYQGTDQRPGLRESETLLVDRKVLEDLSRRYRLGVVTGRPRADAQRFLEKQAIAHCFDAVVCMGDAAAKPDPAPVRLALERLGVTRAWMVGDTPDDIRAARAAGVLPLGAAFQQDDPPDAEALLMAGAARVLDHPDELVALALKEMTHGEP